MKKPVDPPTSRMIIVVGTHALQNELVVSALQKKTCLHCVAVEDMAQIQAVPQNTDHSPCLVLYDCLDKDGKVSEILE